MIAAYITTEELQQYLVLQDEELNEQYQQLRKTNKAFYIREIEVTSRTPFSWKHPFRNRKEIVMHYEVLEDLGGQARVCSFPTAKGSEWSFRTMINELDLKTFIYGFLNGTNSTLADLANRNEKPKFDMGQLVKVVNVDTMQKICKDYEWIPSADEERCCGCQFAVYDIRWSYSSKNYVYQLGQWGHCINWVREEFIEEYEEVEQPASEYVMSKGDQERLQKQMEEEAGIAELIKTGFLKPDAKLEKPLSEVMEKLSRKTLDKVQEILSKPPR